MFYLTTHSTHFIYGYMASEQTFERTIKNIIPPLYFGTLDILKTFQIVPIILSPLAPRP